MNKSATRALLSFIKTSPRVLNHGAAGQGGCLGSTDKWKDLGFWDRALAYEDDLVATDLGGILASQENLWTVGDDDHRADQGREAADFSGQPVSYCVAAYEPRTSIDLGKVQGLTESLSYLGSLRCRTMKDDRVVCTAFLNCSMLQFQFLFRCLSDAAKEYLHLAATTFRVCRTMQQVGAT
jgi:hypothetical protein